MSYLIRKANQNDISHLQILLNAYMHETYQGVWSGDTQRLEQHVSGNDVEIIVAENSVQEVIAFIAWVSTYDLHYCMKGGDVIDFYVAPPHRGHGVAMLLIISLAAEIQKHGGVFLKGGAVDNPAVRHSYERIAMCLPGGESYVSGRAFRHLVELSGKTLREIVRNLPETAWNYEP